MFSTLLELFSVDILRVGLAAYGDMLAQYQTFFRIAVALWAVGISFEALTSDRSFRPAIIKFLRGAVVIVYLSEPAIPHAFAELMQAPGETSGILVAHVLKRPNTATSGNFGKALDEVLEDIQPKTEKLTKRSWYSLPPIVGYIKLLIIYVFLTGFLAVVLYIAALATFFQAALLFLLPFAVSLYPWSYTRPIFDGVIRQGISFSLVIPLLNVLLAMVVSPLITALDDVSGSIFNLVPFGVLAVVGSLLALQIPSVAAGVAGGVGMPILRPR